MVGLTLLSVSVRPPAPISTPAAFWTNSSWAITGAAAGTSTAGAAVESIVEAAMDIVVTIARKSAFMDTLLQALAMCTASAARAQYRSGSLKNFVPCTVLLPLRLRE